MRRAAAGRAGPHRPGPGSPGRERRGCSGRRPDWQPRRGSRRSSPGTPDWRDRGRRPPDVDLAAYGLDPASRVSRVTIAASPAEVASPADVLSIHVALGPETRALVDADLLALLRPGAFVINTSRAEVVDHEALA